MFQVGNIGEISDDDIAFFLHTLKMILLKSRMTVSKSTIGSTVTSFRTRIAAPVLTSAPGTGKPFKPVLVVS